MLSDRPTLEEIDDLLEKIHRQECRFTSGALIHKMKSATIAAKASLLKLRDKVEKGCPEPDIAAQVERARYYLRGLWKYGIHLD